jgi:hypothetical protein
MPRPRARHRRRLLAIGVGVIALVLVAGQLVLPAIAARVARDQIGDDRAQVDVRAVPAWKLIAGHVDELRISTPTLDVENDDLTALLRRARKVGEGRIVIGTLRVAGVPIAIRDVTATLDHGQVQATAAITLSELEPLLPAGAELTPEPPHPDGVPRLRASVELFGARTAVTILVRAQDGRLEVAGASGVASAIRVPLFDNEALRIDDLRGTFDGDVLTVRIRATLR